MKIISFSISTGLCALVWMTAVQLGPEAAMAAPKASKHETPPELNKLKVVKDQYLVTYRGNLSVFGQQGAEQALSHQGAKLGPRLSSERPSFVVQRLPRREGAEFKREFVEYDPNDTFCTNLKSADRSVQSCTPDWAVQAMEIPDDQYYLDYCWNMWPDTYGGSDAEGAWDLSRGSNTIIVAVIDTGIDYSHPDLVNNVWTNRDEESGTAGVDDDGNGYIDDIHGINLVPGTCATNPNCGDPMDDEGHGTHVSGTIGAEGNNTIGVPGVNWTTSIMALKFLDDTGTGATSDAILAINYAVAMKQAGRNILVANNSWGGGDFSQELEDAISSANAAGILFTAAAGNGDSSNRGLNNDQYPHYPSSYEVDNIIAVASYWPWRLSSFSNFSATAVDIAAPGEVIASTYPGNQYTQSDGTSMATPLVSGALALLQAYEFATNGSYLSVEQAKQRLYETAVQHAGLQGVLANGGRAVQIENLLRNITPAPYEPEYCAQEIPFNPPDMTSASSEVVGDGDESFSNSRALPFAFPLYGTEMSTYIVSTNGVIYLDQAAPTEGDFWNYNAAPAKALTAFWSDLTQTGGEYTFKTLSSSEQITFQWTSKHYSWDQNYGTLGKITAWLTLFPSGIVEAHVLLEAANPAEFREWVGRRSTIGVHGSADDEIITFHYNTYPNIPLPAEGGLGVRFKPCAVPDPTATPTPTATSTPTATAAPIVTTPAPADPTASPTPTSVYIPRTPVLTSATLRAKRLRSKKTGAISYLLSGQALNNDSSTAAGANLILRCQPSKGKAKTTALQADTTGEFSKKMKAPKQKTSCQVESGDGTALSNKVTLKPVKAN